MDLRHLRYFVSVAEQLSFSKAARQLHIAEPPLNRQIRRMEEELGIQLLLRDRRGVALTHAGSILLKEARSLLAHASHLMEVVQLARKGEVGVVRVGVGTGLGEPLRPVLTEHANRFPSIEVSCVSVFSTFQADALRERQIDIGFLRSSVDSDDFSSEPVFAEKLVVLLSRKHALAKRRKITIGDLADEPLLLPYRKITAGLHEKVLDLYRQAGIKPNISTNATAPFDEAQIMAVALGKGVCIAVENVLAYPGRGKSVKTVPLDAPDARMIVRMAWRQNETSAAVLAFLDTARGVFRYNSEASRRESTLPAPREKQAGRKGVSVPFGGRVA